MRTIIFPTLVLTCAVPASLARVTPELFVSIAGDSIGSHGPVAQPEVDTGAQENDPIETSLEADDWRIEVTAWAWTMGIEGDIGVKGNVAEVSASFLDVLEASDSLMAFSGRVEVRKGKWGGFIDSMYANIGIDGVSGSLGFADIDFTQELWVTDFAAMYRAGHWTPTGSAAENSRDTTLDLYAGGRFTKLDLELDPAGQSASSGSKDWLDPIVGAMLEHPLSKNWHIVAIADIGGFGVESDLTWSTTAVAGVDFEMFKHPATGYFGYRAVGQDFTDGSGNDEFTWDVILHGAIVGLTMDF